jgi:hypothetical protein
MTGTPGRWVWLCGCDAESPVYPDSTAANDGLSQHWRACPRRAGSLSWNVVDLDTGLVEGCDPPLPAAREVRKGL